MTNQQRQDELRAFVVPAGVADGRVITLTVLGTEEELARISGMGQVMVDLTYRRCVITQAERAQMLLAGHEMQEHLFAGGVLQ